MASLSSWNGKKCHGHKHLLTDLLKHQLIHEVDFDDWGAWLHAHGVEGDRRLDGDARQLGVHPGETTADGAFTLETQNCLGGCALGPIVVADGHYFSKVKMASVSGTAPRRPRGG